MSAVSRAPVEVWAEIFESLFYDRALVNPNPFYPGCNLHTALMEWHDLSRLHKIETQRGTLRLVSNSWRVLADSVSNQFIELGRTDASMPTASKVFLTSRMHLKVKQQTCQCGGGCLCLRDHYDESGSSARAKKQLSKELEELFSNLRKGTVLPVTILMLSSKWWDKLRKLHSSESHPMLFSNVHSLSITVHAEEISFVPQVYPNLTFLSIRPEHGTEIANGQIDLPSLVTLVLFVCHSQAIPSIDLWNMPQLQHLTLKDSSHDTDVTDQVKNFIAKGWPSLISLRLLDTFHRIQIPRDFWDHFPNLRYLGVTSMAPESFAPPEWHPIHTLGIFDIIKHASPRYFIPEIVGTWSQLKVIAEIHSWENVPKSYLTFKCDLQRPFAHQHYDPACHLCILATADLCYAVGIRYEDRYGRSFEEYVNGKSTISRSKLGLGKSMEW